MDIVDFEYPKLEDQGPVPKKKVSAMSLKERRLLAMRLKQGKPKEPPKQKKVIHPVRLLDRIKLLPGSKYYRAITLNLKGDHIPREFEAKHNS